jgi:hypothetical protein
METREHPPSTQETSMAGLWEVMPEIRERPPSTQETSTVGSLGGDAEDPGASTINTRNIDVGLPRCPPSTQETSTMAPPGTVVTETRECPPST